MKTLRVLILMSLCSPVLAVDVVYVEGWVDVRYGDGERVEALIGDRLSVGDTVITDEASRAELESGDTTLIKIDPETIFTVQETERNGEKRSVFSTIVGAATYRVAKLGQKGPLFATPTTTAGVRGTEFQVFSGADGTSLIVVKSGEVSVTAAGGSVSLFPNEAVEIAAGGRPGEKFTVLRGQMDFSAWNAEKTAAIAADPVGSVQRVEDGINVLRNSIRELLPIYEENRARLVRERQKLEEIAKNKGKEAQTDYYEDVVFPLEIETSYMRLNLRYYALSALSFRRYVLGSMYVSVKTRLIDALDGETFRAFRRTYARIRDTFDTEIMPLLVEADF